MAGLDGLLGQIDAFYAWTQGLGGLLLGWLLAAIPMWAGNIRRRDARVASYLRDVPVISALVIVVFTLAWRLLIRDWMQGQMRPATFATARFLPFVIIPAVSQLVTLWWHRPSQAAQTDAHRRGTRIVDGAMAQRNTLRLKSKPGPGPLTLADVAVPESDATKHFKFIGTTGVGKTTAIAEIIGQALALGQRVVFADPDGGYLKRFYDPRRGDLILSPFHEQGRKWDLFAEIRQPYDVEQLARSLIPREDEWNNYARVLFAGVCQRLHEQGSRDVGEFYRLLTSASPDELRPLVAGTPAEPLIAQYNERMFGSVRAVMTTACSGLDYVRRQQAASLSVREWVRAGQGGRQLGALFLPYSAGQIAALRGILSTWMRLAIFETMEGPENGQKLWFVIDELDALGPINGLKDALARVRKFGGRVILGFQSIAQVRTLYGDGEARTIVENCGNSFVLRCSASEGGGTARFASQLIGEREIIRTQTSTSIAKGGGDDRESVSTSIRHVTEDAVMPSEIEQLPDLVGYLKLASRPEWLLLQLPAPTQSGSGRRHGPARSV